MIRFRVATYNVHKCRGMDWKVRPARVLHIIQEINPDILALQEIFEPQAEYLSEHARMGLAFGPTRAYAGVPYGNAVLSRYPIGEERNHDLTVAGKELRSCLQVQLEIQQGRALEFFATHLGTSFFERRQQAVRLTSTDLLGQPATKGRRILAGDFNEWTRGLATRMLTHQLKSADVDLHLQRGRTYPGAIPFWHLDHVYYDPEFRLTTLRLHRNRRALVASDHLPLIADFETA